jgi:hypothetical protein
MQKYDRIFWTPCAAHCIDLMLEDIGKLPRFQKVITMGKKITSFIYLHSRLHSAFLERSNGKELVRCGVTRFATSYLTLQSMHDLRGCLKQLFVSDMWNTSPWTTSTQGS